MSVALTSPADMSSLQTSRRIGGLEIHRTISLCLFLFVWRCDCMINPSDILNVEYLPSTLLLEEATIEKEMREAQDNLTKTTSDGDIREAYLTMQYHRSKMNEYMCRVYVADEILSGLGENQVGRLGTPASNHRTSNRDHFLTDQGSSSYKDWLSRSTLLDDVYRHYDSIMSGSEEIESGEVTGYAVQGGGKTTGSGSLYSSTGGYGYGPSHSFNPHPAVGGDEYYIHHDLHEHEGKSLAVKDLFDLALTALAFLAFGVFAMNLIMTCMIGNQGTTIVMQTTTTTSTDSSGSESSDNDDSASDSESIPSKVENDERHFVQIELENEGRDEQTRRRRRSTEDELNHLAYRVSRSIETFMGLGEGRQCLRYNLCRDNRYSRSLSQQRRVWLPLWSFGLSWVSGHVGGDRLANLRGAVLGLGAANCEDVYPQCRL